MQIFKLKYFFLILLSLLITNKAYAFDKNSVIRVDNNAQNKAVYYGVSTDKKRWALLFNNITFFKDNTLVVPVIPYDQSKKEYLSNELRYIFIDCRAPGVIMYDQNLANPTNLNENTIGGLARNYFCKSRVDNKNVIWTNVFIDNQSRFNPYILYLDDIRIDNEIISYKYSGLNRDTKKSIDVTGHGSRAEGQVNCNENSLSDGTSKKYYADKSHDLKFLMDTLCGRNEVLKINNVVVDRNSYTNDINQTCAELGFTKGSINYEKCVLQLLDK